MYVKRGVFLVQLQSEFPSLIPRGCFTPVMKIVRIVDASNFRGVIVSVDDASLV